MLYCTHIQFSGHAIQRMFEKRISKPEILSILGSAEIIAEYPDDKPFPSYLLHGFVNSRPIHLVVAVDAENENCYVVTVYIPSSDQWLDDFRTRRNA